MDSWAFFWNLCVHCTTKCQVRRIGLWHVPLKCLWCPEQWCLCEGIHWRPVPSRACLSPFKSLFSSWRCGGLSPHTWQLKPSNPDNLSSDERGARNKTLSCPIRIYWLANETKITCKNVALFESSLGFTWEIANYRQVQSGAKRLQLHSLTFYQAQTHSCTTFVRKMFAFTCWPSLCKDVSHSQTWLTGMSWT